MTDVIERSVWIQAPVARVWRAVTTPREFGEWFRVALDQSEFVEGQPATGQMLYPGCEHLRMTLDVETVAPEHTFAFRWHPYAIEAGRDYSDEDKTLVTFTLAEENGGTRLTVRESGFEGVPEARRELAFRMNDGGWEIQVDNVRRYVESG